MPTPQKMCEVFSLLICSQLHTWLGASHLSATQLLLNAIFSESCCHPDRVPAEHRCQELAPIKNHHSTQSSIDSLALLWVGT